MTDNEELKPCPFCGNNHILYHRQDGWEEWDDEGLCKACHDKESN